MLQERIQHQRREREQSELVATIPEYPIYRETLTCYTIYVDGQRQIFPSEATARLGRIVARERWLRAHT